MKNETKQITPEENPELKKALAVMREGGYTCVLCSGGEVRTSTSHGIRPLLDWIEDTESFEGFYAADQIVGKAAALLYVKMGIAALYADVLSEKAVRILEQYEIPYAAGRTVPHIINRTGDGMCPMEQTVLDIEDPDAAFKALKTKAALMRK